MAVRGVEMAVTSLEICEDQSMAGWSENEWPRYRQYVRTKSGYVAEGRDGQRRTGRGRKEGVGRSRE